MLYHIVGILKVSELSSAFHMQEHPTVSSVLDMEDVFAPKISITSIKDGTSQELVSKHSPVHTFLL